ncbi:MAG: hypothetical protein DMF84_17735 [Acidobacteria bacterium]|nr:MAG: hypothetical protein DMF84_17735 [Acidobacteriota bacterium]
MTFANPLPGWALLLVISASALVAWLAYRRVPLSARRRHALSALRLITLLWLILCLMRPVTRASEDTHDAIVPILIDASRSMGLADVDGGRRRIDVARGLLERQLLPAIAPRFHAELLRFGDNVSAAEPATLSATDRRTSLGRALQAVRDRYRGRPVAGIVLVSDGGDNGDVDAIAAAATGAPIYAVGIGPKASPRDREVVSVTAAESVLSDAVVDVAVSAVSHGYGAAPIELRLLENGRAIDLRRVTPAADGVPVTQTFRVSPNRDVPTVYTVEVPAAGDEIVAENNARSALVPAAARPRRVLFVEGAPGFEHSFLRRAWAGDRGLEVDAVVRKGRDESGADTFYVQAVKSRADALTGGFPKVRASLFGYDVVVLANVDPDMLSSDQLELTRAFVAERGGGLLVLGARAFQRQGFRGTALEDVVPLELTDRVSGVQQATASPGMNRVALTRAGEDHPLMQLAATPEDNLKRWASVPPLAAVSPLGGPRRGASVLAVTGGPGGVPRALVAVQRYGEGRSMVFTGEAFWRWRMMLPASDPSYDRFWRQAARWLGQGAPDTVSLLAPVAATPGDVPIVINARDSSYAPERDATVDVRVTGPGGRVETVRAQPDVSQSGRYRATVHAAQAGVYRVAAEARARSATLGSATSAVLVGGVDPEMTDPRLNEDTLSRVARASGGQVLAAGDEATLVDRLRTGVPAAALAVRRDLWHTGWSFAIIALLLAAEWLLRRSWGLR